MSADYDELQDHLDEVTLSDGRKILQSRILKLPLYDDDREFTYQAMGRELLESGEFQKSISTLKKVIIINPHNCEAQVHLAKALFKLEKEDEAFSSIKKALSLNPEYHTLHQLLIEKLEEKHRLKDLESLSKEIVEMIGNPESVPVFYFTNAMALLDCDKSAQALVTYRKGMESDPPMKCEDHFNYGLVLYYEGLFEDAIVQFEHAQSLRPDSSYTLNYIALQNYCLGRVQKAKEEYDYIMQNGKEMNLTQSNVLLVLAHLDEDDEAIHQYRDHLKPFITQEGSHLKKNYHEQLKITQKILEREDIDEKTREFNTKKLKAINFALSA